MDNKNIQDALSMLSQGRSMVSQARHDIKSFLTNRCSTGNRFTAEHIVQMRHSGAPYSRCLEFAVTCIARGCDPDEIKAALEGQQYE